MVQTSKDGSFHNNSVHQYTIKVHKKINNLKSRNFEDYFMRNHYLENVLIDFRVIIGIILLKVAIPLDVVSIYKSCGRMRDGKRSCLFTYSTTERKVVVG